MTRFLSIYLLLAIVGMSLLEFSVLDDFYHYLGIFLATCVVVVIHLFDSSVIVTGAILSQPNSGFSIEVNTECEAIEFTWLYCAAILAWNAMWKYKLLWILFGIVFIQILNIIRLISLIYLGRWYPDYFVMIHENFYPMFFAMMIIILFLNWILFINLHPQRTTLCH